MATRGVPEGAEFVYSVGIQGLESQSKRLESLDHKTEVLMIVEGVGAGLLLSESGGEFLGPPIGAVLSILLTLSFGFLIGAFWTRSYATAPELSAMVPMMTRDKLWLKWRFLQNIEDAIAINAEKLDFKAQFLSVALFFLLGDLLILTAYFISNLWS